MHIYDVVMFLRTKVFTGSVTQIKYKERKYSLLLLTILYSVDLHNLN